MKKYDYTLWNNFFKEQENEPKTIRFKNYTRIPQTDIQIGVPYLIDVKKYVEACGKRETRMSEISNRTVNFQIDITTYAENNTVRTLFVFSNDYDTERDNAFYHYDCFQFHSFREGESLDDFIEFFKKIFDCVEGIDKDVIDRKIDKKIKEIDNLNKEIEILKTIK